MKYKLYILSLVLMVSACTNNNPPAGHEEHSQHEAKKIYTCPMHPEIIRDKPGQCPICGMDLVEKKSEGESIKDTSLQFLLKPTNQYVLSKVKTVNVEEKELPVEFNSTGTITYDTRMINTVSARVAGRIERLYIKYRFQPISKGQKLMDIYSKDLVTEQENYLFLLNNDSENKIIIAAAESKLGLMGLTSEQINKLKKTKKVFQSITIFSPYSGHLHDVQPTSATDGMAVTKMETQELTIHEGMYVEKGQTVFNIYSTDKVWAVLNIYAEKQEALKKGLKVKLQVDGIDEPITSKIDFIEPVIRADIKTITARVYLDNPHGELKIGAVLKATITGLKTKGLFLPKEAVLNIGLNNIAFAQRDSLFEAVQVKLGNRTDGWIEIVSGLQKNQKVAVNAQLLMDSESFVKTGKQ